MLHIICIRKILILFKTCFDLLNHHWFEGKYQKYQKMNTMKNILKSMMSLKISDCSYRDKIDFSKLETPTSALYILYIDKCFSP